MKQYLLFAGANYYPCGGWDDFVKDFDNLAEAKAACVKYDTKSQSQWFHIIDTTTMQEVV